MARCAAKLIAPYADGATFPVLFDACQELGVHVTPVHFYSPIPDTRRLEPLPWQRRSEMVGVDMNIDRQLDLVSRVFPQFAGECMDIPPESSGIETDFYFNNNMFEGTDALVLYCMVRHFRPRRVLEAGSGYSSLITLKAAARNGDVRLTCYDPHPPKWLPRVIVPPHRLYQKALQNIALDEILSLKRNDILFVDTTHVARYGSDVSFLFREVLPRLAPGVVVHLHDIFLPGDYPSHWLRDKGFFFNEQYLLHCFLAFNDSFEVLCCNSLLGADHLEMLKSTFPNSSPWWGGGSFWMRRTE